MVGRVVPEAADLDADVSVESEQEEATAAEEEEVSYASPIPPRYVHFVEHFDDPAAFERRWVRSQAKKDDTDEDIAKYDGEWGIESLQQHALPGDRGLVLKSKAKHAAISTRLTKPFHFLTKPLVVQYEVNMQNGQECGGAYLKLLSDSPDLDPAGFRDKTPYTIMFGPDKCGNDHKLHFIFRHRNPVTGDYEEKHAKRATSNIESSFTDKATHLYKLVVRPDSSFEVLLDDKVVNSGSLLEDMTPPVNPPEEIDDKEDFKPADWDEREKVPDPEAKKPADWDEEAPAKIADPAAVRPAGWLEDTPEMVPDPEAERPDDWDTAMDGEWEAALVSNPLCAEAPGCGVWSAPMVDNPEYKGKWRPALVDNPAYRGKWAPRRIPNPAYFEDKEPFKMTSIGAVGIELWSMSDNIYFDNIIITDSLVDAHELSEQTFQLKAKRRASKEAGVIERILKYSNDRPWMYAVYIIAIGLPLVMVVFFCCFQSSKEADPASDRKKTDEPEPDDEIEEEVGVAEEEEDVGAEEEETEGGGAEEEEGGVAEEEEDQEEDQEEEEADQPRPEDKHEGVSEAKPEEGQGDGAAATRSSPRRRRPRRE